MRIAVSSFFHARATGLSSILAFVLGCVNEPAEIGYFETGGEESADPSHDRQIIEWDLCEGATVAADLGTSDIEAVTVGGGVHHVVIEVVPIHPPTFPAGFSAAIQPLYGEAAFEAFGAGLRYEGPLQLGWSVLLHADEQSSVELRGQIIAASDETEGDRTLYPVMRNLELGALTLTSMVALFGCDKPDDESGEAPHSAESGCESEYSPHPFLASPCPELWPNPEDAFNEADPACHAGMCRTLEFGGIGIGYAWCTIQCEDVGDCAQWDPGASVVACVAGECTWYCDEAHPCPSELECGPPHFDPNWGQCWAAYSL